MVDFCENCGIFLVSDKECKLKLCNFCLTKQPELVSDRRKVKQELENWLIQLRSKRTAGIKKWK
jgi:hypothetical protein